MASAIEHAARALVADNGESFNERFDHLAFVIDIANSDKELKEQYRTAAYHLHDVAGELEIDDDAIVSLSEEGAYVQAWRWIADTDIETDDEEEIL